MAILNIVACGPSFQNIIIALIALFTFLSNFRALLRLNEKLIVDHYGIPFIISSCFSIMLAVGAGALVFYFRPVVPNMKKYGVTKTTAVYAGTLETGFFTPDKPMDTKTAFVHHYEPKDNTKDQSAEKRMILFIPNENATTAIYEPMLVKLAHDGYIVYSADFYFHTATAHKVQLASKSMKREAFLKLSLTEPETYEEWKTQEKSSYDAYLYKSLLSIVSPQDSDFVILVGDCTDEKMFFSIKKNDERIDTCFDLSIIDDYDTKGYGPVEQTDPVLALLLGKKRDSSMYVSNHTANRLEQLIQQSMQVKAPSEQATF